ncbi:MAG: radical SAM family heme chaperone HemW [Bacteroidetes bacterium]|nr:radical SAM family heme chaperone HemW [Bacteroidota bacterium]
MPSHSRGISLYVHVPFCAQRCTYCDFFFVTTKQGYDDFVTTLCQEVAQFGDQNSGQSSNTIYFGGGTPSRLSPQSIRHILRAIDQCFDTANVSEITLEANPEDISASRLEQFLDSGVTRISLGVQSFSNQDLKFMNRSHDAHQAMNACTLIDAAGFESWSLDLIFGVPGTSLLDWEKNLILAIETGVSHISSYSLSIESNTPLHKQVKRGIVNPVTDSEMSDQYQMTIDTLVDAGFEHYEISSFAYPGHRSQHNSNYWSHQNYLGFGPSAHSFWWDNEMIVRWKNVSNLRSYHALIREKKSPANFRESLTIQDLIREKIMLSIRTSVGINLSDLRERYGYALVEDKRDELLAMESNGLIYYDQTSIRLTERGKHICDQITEQLWPT